MFFLHWVGNRESTSHRSSLSTRRWRNVPRPCHMPTNIYINVASKPLNINRGPNTRRAMRRPRSLASRALPDPWSGTNECQGVICLVGCAAKPPKPDLTFFFFSLKLTRQPQHFLPDLTPVSLSSPFPHCDKNSLQSLALPGSPFGPNPHKYHWWPLTPPRCFLFYPSNPGAAGVPISKVCSRDIYSRSPSRACLNHENGKK